MFPQNQPSRFICLAAMPITWLKQYRSNNINDVHTSLINQTNEFMTE
jgi:hypothetical protein